MTRPTGRGSETIEDRPSHCPAGHELGPGRVLVGYGPAPGGGRARWWRCRECGQISYGETDSSG